jgi:hypothetical protein
MTVQRTRSQALAEPAGTPGLLSRPDSPETGG